MKLHFYKYHGTGNDFILIDGRSNQLESLSAGIIQKLCHRRFGIGADGLMILTGSKTYDFEMNYYNSDGSGATMCGNGGRCIAEFARYLGICKSEANFLASDGLHTAYFKENNLIELKMQDVSDIIKNSDTFFMNTGSPHVVKFVKDADEIDVLAEGRKIRYGAQYQPTGTNVNFVSKTENGIYVRTYERGVEDETYSCGTGSVASAIAYFSMNYSIANKISIKTRGGDLEVGFNSINNQFTNIYLKGPALLVFEGHINV